MKKPVFKLLAILFYLYILLYLSGFNFFVLFDFKILILTVLGSVLLSLPHYRKTLSRNDMLDIVGKNALATSYIETFIYLFARLNNTEGFDNILSDIALNCIPVLYGFVIYIILKSEEDKASIDENKNVPETLENKPTTEELYLTLKELGLTKRETEISRLILNGYSNNEIADELCISETTVKKHVSNVFNKLQITKREQIRSIIRKK